MTLALIATIPPRRASCERLLGELTQQTLPPAGVILCLDGYGDAPAPRGPLPVALELRTERRLGPGGRWRAAAELPGDTLLVAVDDDCALGQAPRFVEALVGAAGEAGAAAAAGLDLRRKRAYPGDPPRGRLLYGVGCGLTVRARHLLGLSDLATRIRAAGGPDMLGPLGDDDALVSAHLWLQKIPIEHAATGVWRAASGTVESSQTRERARLGGSADVQKCALRKIMGWPWPVDEQQRLRAREGTG